MDKKAAIMTWFTYKNFGTVLQASALYNVVDNLGYKPYMIQYKPKGVVEEKTGTYLIRRCVNKMKSMLKPQYVSEKRSDLYNEYIDKRFKVTKECLSHADLCDLNSIYDVFLCGSDQIWSPLSFDDKYFLSFVKNTDKIIAYAPSLGSTKIVNPIIRNRMATLISRFEHLSVREQQGADVIKEMTGQEARVVLDPTLLMDSSEWDVYVREEEVQKSLGPNYIICYFLGDADKYMGYVRRLSETMKIPYYVIPITMKQKRSRESVPFEVGPCEFVSLIRNAKYVCTDSFHGVAFSVNYNVSFSVFKRFKDSDLMSQNSRITNLLRMLGLEHRLVDYHNKRSAQTEIECDFTESNKKLDIERKKSLDYLKSALKSAMQDVLAPESGLFEIADMCCGCGACASICERGAISIARCREGFEHYSIEPTKCVRCGRCKSVCPMTGISALDMKEAYGLYSVKSYSEQTLKKSSSGGMGHELASYLLGENYAICGCMYDDRINVAKHIWIMPEEKEKLALLQGSKYIQSITADSMKKLERIAKEHKIAFFGTPCQAAGADKILRQKGVRENAIVIDLICHGVPSYYLWDKYLTELNKKYGTGEHPTIAFRNKERGWRRRTLLVDGNESVYKKEERRDDFYAFFRRGLCDMEACSDCPYRERSAADLRMGDYWGDKFVADKQGVSMVIANTVRGEDVIGKLVQNEKCQVEKQKLSDYWSVQYPYNPQKPLVREQLIEELKNERKTLHSLRRKYCRYYDFVEVISPVILKLKKIIGL